MRPSELFLRPAVVAALVLGVAGCSSASPPASPAPTTAAPDPGGTWELDEPEGAATAEDSSGNGVDGEVGADVRTGVAQDGVVAYRFPDVPPNAGPVRPGHLVTVPHSPVLNPDDEDYEISIRFRTTTSAGNILQKGQSGTPGGFWKIDHDNGRVKCSFQGADTELHTVVAPRPIDDGEWHEVVCVRTPESIELRVDLTPVESLDVRTGTVANDWEMVIGGKSRCDQESIGCDYFSGDVDYVRISKG